MANTKKFSHTNPNAMIAGLYVKAPKIEEAKRDKTIKFGTMDVRPVQITVTGETSIDDNGSYVFEGPIMKAVSGIRLKDKNNKKSYYAMLQIDPTKPEHKQWRMSMRHLVTRIGQFINQHRSSMDNSSAFKGMDSVMEKTGGKFTNPLDTFENVCKVVQPMVMEYDKDKNAVPLDTACFQYALVKHYEWQGKTVRAPLLFSIPLAKYAQFTPNNMPELIKGLTYQLKKNDKTGTDNCIFTIPWEKVHNCALTIQPLFELERIHFKPASKELMLPKFQITSMTLLNVEKINMTTAQSDALDSAADNADEVLAGFASASAGNTEASSTPTVPTLPPNITLPGSNGINPTAGTNALNDKIAQMNGASSGTLDGLMTGSNMPKLPGQ